jgi:hypothetical protein
MDYVIDDRSNKISGDPHASVYITKKIDLKQPATSLKILVGACRTQRLVILEFYINYLNQILVVLTNHIFYSLDILI